VDTFRRRFMSLKAEKFIFFNSENIHNSVQT
jgi:hypothetical protein